MQQSNPTLSTSFSECLQAGLEWLKAVFLSNKVLRAAQSALKVQKEAELVAEKAINLARDLHSSNVKLIEISTTLMQEIDRLTKINKVYEDEFEQLKSLVDPSWDASPYKNTKTNDNGNKVG